MKILNKVAIFLLTFFLVLASDYLVKCDDEITEQPLSKIAIHRAVLALHDEAFIQAYPTILGLKV